MAPLNAGVRRSLLTTNELAIEYFNDRIRAEKEISTMRSQMSTRIFTFSFLLFAIPILLLASSFVSKAQGQTIASELEGTKWEAEHSKIYSLVLDETLIRQFFCTFEKQGKVTCEIRVTVYPKLKYEWEYDYIEKRDRLKTVFVPPHQRPDLRVIREGTYKQNGNSIQIDLSFEYKIEATIKGDEMYGEVTLDGIQAGQVRWTAKRTSGGGNSSAASTVKESLPPNVIREANGQVRPVDGYRWVNSQDPKDLRVELIPSVGESEQPTSNIDKEQRAMDFLGKAFDLTRQKKYSEAIESFTMAINLMPDFPEAYVARARTKFEIQNYQGAIADYDQALRIWKAGTSKSGGLTDRAMRLALMDLRMDLRSESPPIFPPQVYLDRGDAKHMLGDKAGACDDFRKACSEGMDKGCESSKQVCN